MSTTSTPNLSLVKPTPGTGEYADVSVINGNMDKIDAAVGELTETLNLIGADVVTASSGFTLRQANAAKVGRFAYIDMGIRADAAYTSGEITIGTLARVLCPYVYTNVTVMKTNPSGLRVFDIDTNGVVKTNTSNFAIESGSSLWIRGLLMTGE